MSTIGDSETVAASEIGLVDICEVGLNSTLSSSDVAPGHGVVVLREFASCVGKQEVSIVAGGGGSH